MARNETMVHAGVGLELISLDLRRARARQRTREHNISLHVINIGNVIKQMEISLADLKKIVKKIRKLEKQESEIKQTLKRVNRNAGTNSARSGTYGKP